MKRLYEPRESARALGLLATGLFIVSIVAAGNATFAAPVLNSVVVGLAPSANLPYQYTLTAYNTSGYQVASYQTVYPSAGFQLPAGAYLISASAYYQNNTYCLKCVQGATAGGSEAGGVAVPIRPYYGPYVEYGYAVTQVSGQSSVTIKLQNASAIPLTTLKIHVAYANGTAAAGASVSGYVVGSYYVYSPKMLSYGQAGKDGIVTLTMPQAPVEVDAYLSMPINLPKNSSVVTVQVGGQKLNVTVSLQPSYLSLYGQALVLPPQTSASITLHYQPNDQPIVYASGVSGGVATAGSTAPTTTGQGPASSSSTSTQMQATRIAPFNPGVAVPTESSPPSTANPPATGDDSTLLLGIAAVGALVVVALAALLVKNRRSGAPPA